MPVSVGSKKQDLAVSEHGIPYEMGALSVLQALLSEEESRQRGGGVSEEESKGL